MPGFERLLVQLLFFLPRFNVLVLAAIDFREHLQRAGVLRAQLQQVLQCVARVAERVILQVLAGQFQPLIHLGFTAARLDAGFERERRAVGRVEL